MKAPLKWLRDYVNIDVSLKEYAEAMTMSGTKVEGYELLGEGISDVVIGKILEIKKHPGADKLVITSIDTGSSEMVQIVTGASNINVGDLIPVALDGATLPGGVKIVKGNLRGEISNGMLCSGTELGVDERFLNEKSKGGIWILEEEYPLGMDATEALGINDAIVEFELTSNRPDCQSMIGLAYETAATLNVQATLPPANFTEDQEAMNFQGRVVDEDLCPRYILREIKDVVITQSPWFIQRRLMEAGVRPVNNMVDLTNYVMLEYGQPMHAFDSDKIPTGQIKVQRAKNGASFITLDDQERKLDDTMLMITDGEQNIGIAGVMGGQNTEIDNNTKHIILESATFNADSIRLTSKKLGLRTEASSRFEKGIDLSRAEEAMNRACHLIETYGWGKVLSGKVDSLKELPQKTVITTPIARIQGLIGEEISVNTMVELLERLYFNCQIEGDAIRAEIPSFRMDMTMDADITEEIARLYGYNKITSRNILGELTAGEKSSERIFEDRIKDAMNRNGLMEILTYSFVSPGSLEKVGEDMSKVVRLLNPLGEETSVMRTSLLPALLETMAINLAKKVEFFAGFEVGNVFQMIEGNPVQKRAIVAGSYGKEEDFYKLKARLEGLLDELGIEERNYIPWSQDPNFHPGRCAKVMSQGKVLGYLGEVHPMLAENFDIKKRVYVLTLDFETLAANAKAIKLYKPVPKFPSIRRDIAVVVEEKVYVSQIEEIIKEAGGALLESVELFDIYRGGQVPEGMKSVAYALTYRKPDATLKDEEINPFQEKVLQALDTKLGAKIREM